ncbi:MAG: hypothetical protein L6R41_006769 [Letrouitia leprolyta]|nr:MAG: hypothetical protein L6R41_006769 [Letrouitia leprolyta]
MASRKYNEFLDAGLNDDDDSPSHDSDDAQESKSRSVGSSKVSKRQKTRRESSDNESDNDLEPPLEPSLEYILPSDSNATILPSQSTSIDEDLPPSQPAERSSSKTTNFKLLTKSSSRSRKPGVVYLSRIPPFMRPSTVRHILGSFGTITRLFLTPEPPSQHTSRVRSGGNKKRSFIDGWIEFSSHKHAKTCVAAINGQTMGGRGYYRDDVWNAKYLRGFGWEDLMAGVRAEEREREERVRVGVRRDKKEREEFLRSVERGKVEDTKRKKRKRKGFDEEKVENGEHEGNDGGRSGRERRFRQNEVKKRRDKEEQPEEVRRVLSKIF